MAKNCFGIFIEGGAVSRSHLFSGHALISNSIADETTEREGSKGPHERFEYAIQVP